MAPATAAPERTENAWYELSGDQVAASMKVDPAQGLTGELQNLLRRRRAPEAAAASEEPAGAPALGSTT
jgi:hypothetical protein